MCWWIFLCARALNVQIFLSGLFRLRSAVERSRSEIQSVGLWTEGEPPASCDCIEHGRTSRTVRRESEAETIFHKNWRDRQVPSVRGRKSFTFRSNRLLPKLLHRRAWKISSTFYVSLINITNLLYELLAAWNGDLNSISICHFCYICAIIFIW